MAEHFDSAVIALLHNDFDDFQLGDRDQFHLYFGCVGDEDVT